MSSLRGASHAWEALFRAQVAILRRIEGDHLMDGLTLTEYDVLFALRTAGRPLRLKELNEYVLMHQSSLSRLVDRLEKRELLSSSPAQDDKRGTVIDLTQRGKDVQRQMGRIHSAQIGHYVGNALTDQELATLEALTTKLRAAQADISTFDALKD